jgi:hypothetical protein
MRVEINTQIRFGLKSEVLFVTAGFRQNLRCLWRMESEYEVSCLSNPAAIRRDRGTKRCFIIKAKAPFVLSVLDETCRGCCACGESATFVV